MPDTKLTSLALPTSAAVATDVVYFVDVSDTTDDVAGSSRKLTLEQLLGWAQFTPGGRLALTSAEEPVPAPDVVGGSILSYQAYSHSSIFLFTAGRWRLYPNLNASMTLSGLIASRPYDVFMYVDTGVSGNLTLELTAWTNDTTRAVAITRVNGGVFCKSTDATRRLLGTIYTTSASTTEDSVANRYVSNLDNQVPRRLHVCPGYVDNNANTSYTTASTTWVEANAGTGSRTNFIVCQPSISSCSLTALFTTSASGGAQVAIGYDSITTGRVSGQSNFLNATASVGAVTGDMNLSGRHYYSLLLASQAGTVTVYADVARASGGAADPKLTFLEGWILA